MPSTNKRTSPAGTMPPPKRRAAVPSSTTSTSQSDSQLRDITVQNRPSGDTIITVTDGQAQRPMEILQIPSYDMPSYNTRSTQDDSGIHSSYSSQGDSSMSNYPFGSPDYIPLTQLSNDSESIGPSQGLHTSVTAPTGSTTTKGKRSAKVRKPSTIQNTSRRLNEHILNSNAQFKVISQSLQNIQAFLKMTPSSNTGATATATATTSSYTPNLFPAGIVSQTQRGNYTVQPTSASNMLPLSVPSSMDKFKAILNNVGNSNQNLKTLPIFTTAGSNSTIAPATSTTGIGSGFMHNRDLTVGMPHAPFNTASISLPIQHATSTQISDTSVSSSNGTRAPGLTSTHAPLCGSQTNSFQPKPAFRPWDIHYTPAHSNTQAINPAQASQSAQGVQIQNAGIDHEIKIVSGGLPLGWSLDQATKDKIMNDQYIDLSDLLEQGNQQNYAVSIDPESGAAFIFTKNKKAIRNIKEWDRAFATYMSVYLQKPDNLRHWAHLITYSNEIKSMADDGLNFLDYDETFRKERAGMSTPWDWNVFRQDLFNRIHRKALAYKTNFNTNRKLVFESKNTGSNIPKVPMGYCFDYHTAGKRCNRLNCSFKHTCTCGRGQHTMYTCRSQGQPFKARTGANGKSLPRSGSSDTSKAE